MRRPLCTRPNDARQSGQQQKVKQDECSPGFAMSSPPQNMTQLMGSRGQPAKDAEQNLQTTHRQPSFSSPRAATETEQPRLSACLLSSGSPRLRVPRPEPRSPVAATKHQHRRSRGGRRPQAPPLLRHWQFTITKRSSAGQQIFLLLRQQARKPQLRKVGQAGLETPYLAGVTLKAPLAAHPQPLLPAAHIPHPTGPGLLCPALVRPAPANTARPLQPVFIYLHHPPLPACLCLTSALFSLILSLSTSWTISQ